MENIFFDLSKLKKLGANSIIGKTVRIRRPELAEIGRNSIIDDFTYISSQLSIGNFTHVGAGCHIIGGPKTKITIGNFVNVAPSCNLVGGQNDYRGGGLVGPTIPEGYGDQSDARSLVIGDHVLIGCNSVILPGVQLPEGVAIGALSLVKQQEYKPWTLYAGIPVKEIGKRDGTKIKQQTEVLMTDVESGLL